MIGPRDKVCLRKSIWAKTQRELRPRSTRAILMGGLGSGIGRAKRQLAWFVNLFATPPLEKVKIVRDCFNCEHHFHL